MKKTYQILTDSSCDLRAEMARELDILAVPLTVNVQGQEHANYLDGDPAAEMEMTGFYNTLRQKVSTSTSAAAPGKWADWARPILSQGLDVLILAFSSGLSATCHSAVLAAEDLRQEFPQRKILVVDTLCASMGQGLLVYHVAKKQQAGATLEEAARWAEENRLHLCHWFTVDDLMFLKRGGRVSATTAVAGTLLNIKPVMHVDDAGKLIKVTTARGRKASIQALVAKAAETAIDPSSQVFFISHGDCAEDAAYMASLLRERFGPVEVVTSYVGPVIGSHSGPGTLALFFLGSKR